MDTGYVHTNQNGSGKESM